MARKIQGEIKGLVMNQFGKKTVAMDEEKKPEETSGEQEGEEREESPESESKPEESSEPEKSE